MALSTILQKGIALFLPAATVLSLLQRANQTYGLPSRI